MMKHTRPPAFLFLMFTMLAACSDIKGALEFADQRDEFRDRRDTLAERSNTAFVAIPDSGTATYRGEASLAAGNDTDGIALVGDARIVVNFGNGVVRGDLDNFGGFDRTKEYSDYAGTLVFVDGVLGVDRPNDLEAQVVGTLTGEDYVLDVDALWEGDLKGTPIIGILGDTNGGQSTFELDGEFVPGGIVIAVTAAP